MSKNIRIGVRFFDEFLCEPFTFKQFVLLDQPLDVTSAWLEITEDSCIPMKEFQKKYVSPFCSDVESIAVVNGLLNQFFAVMTSDYARSNITLYDDAGNPYIEYDDYGIYVKYQYQFIGNSLVVILRECRISDNTPGNHKKKSRDDGGHDFIEEKQKPPP